MGVAEIFLKVEPLTGRRRVVITERRTRKDWALFIRGMLDERYPQATKVRLVMDHLLNPHDARFVVSRGEVRPSSATGASR